MGVLELDKNLDSDDPRLRNYRRVAKEIGLDQDGFSSWVDRTQERLGEREAKVGERETGAAAREAALAEREQALAAQIADYQRLMAALKKQLGGLA